MTEEKQVTDKNSESRIERRQIELFKVSSMRNRKRILSDPWYSNAQSALQQYDKFKATVAQWDTRNQLMLIRIEADEQIAILRKVLSEVERIIPLAENKNELDDAVKNFRIGLFGELGDLNELQHRLGFEKNLEDLQGQLSCENYEYPEKYERIIDRKRLAEILGVNDIGALKSALDTRICLYKHLVDKIKKKKIRLLVLHAIFKLTDKGNLQIGSLVVASLILLGMFYIWFYYQAAAGQFVHSYWTLDDLIIQGITVSWLVAASLFFFELLFRWLLMGFENEDAIRRTTCQWLLRSPSWVVSIFVVFLLFIATVVGHSNGKQSYIEFVLASGADGNQLETATMTDGAVLDNVHLVGTTSRTAVFLQKPDTGGSRNFGEPPRYYETWIRVIKLLPFPYVCANDGLERDGKWSNLVVSWFCALIDQPPPTYPAYNVLVVDRAHVLCHANGTICTTFERIEN